MEKILETQMMVNHPLEPLTPEEIQLATDIVRKSNNLVGNYRFASVMLHEPPKQAVLNYKPGDPVEREVFLVLLDNEDGKTYEAVVSLNGQTLKSWTYVPDVQPAIMLDEFLVCEHVVKDHPDVQAALLKRGITDFDLVMADPWSAGNFGFEEENGMRLARALCWYKKSADDNGYARPISGLYAFVDLNKMEVVKVIDKGATPLPPLDGNYAVDANQPLRADLKPLEINQAEGPSFDINGHEISWQKWKIRFGFNAREGLVLHTVTYRDKGKDRPIVYRASLSEMVVPYGDPNEPVSRNNAFDAGEYGIGMLANSLVLGCDCLGEIRYFDGVLSDSKGNPVIIPNAICLHEEDYGILWKHTDWRTEKVDVRRSRRLVLSSISTVGNYDYGFFWYFYQDGTIEFEVKLTGILHTQALPPNVKSKYGNLLAPQLYGPNHQHFFNVRMDMMLDGVKNSVIEVNTESETEGPHNPYGNAFIAKGTLLKNELEARRDVKTESARYWKIVNPNSKNIVGEPVGYKLFPGENTAAFAHEGSSLMKRAGFIKHHLWVTPYDPEEKYAAGNYPNQHPGGEGLPKWVQKDRSVEDTDIVVWYTMGHHHVTRPEDWPVMPTAYIGFSLKPSGFFDRNPALDVPPSAPKHGSHCMHH
ncbi:primary-amine oxidase [Heyndrickxia coagulans]|uniref:primary-amine oxidase n=1 Tax=Heyndrickxia coagulans TaxID=1398 RepID=UPI000E4EBB2C|nr:primary-amine oxidase [Heyndrickxia coagulans]RGR84986.1 tyramine oxidase [Heyndrickxia coagulans]RGR98218.1 tyramine oxidase [Heyndrickxia coagulans]